MSNNRKHSVGDGGVLPDPGKKAWPDELKQLAGALIDLAAESLASRRQNLVLVEILTADELSDRFKVPVSTIEELARKRKIAGRIPSWQLCCGWHSPPTRLSVRNEATQKKTCLLAGNEHETFTDGDLRAPEIPK
jgi:hypothetical protein